MPETEKLNELLEVTTKGFKLVQDDLSRKDKESEAVRHKLNEIEKQVERLTEVIDGGKKAPISERIMALELGMKALEKDYGEKILDNKNLIYKTIAGLVGVLITALFAVINSFLRNKM